MKFSAHLHWTSVAWMTCFWSAAYGRGTFNRTIRFEGPPVVPPGTDIGITNYYEDSMTFTPINPGDQFGRMGGGRTVFPENGTAFLILAACPNSARPTPFRQSSSSSAIGLTGVSLPPSSRLTESLTERGRCQISRRSILGRSFQTSLGLTLRHTRMRWTTWFSSTSFPNPAHGRYWFWALHWPAAGSGNFGGGIEPTDPRRGSLFECGGSGRKALSGPRPFRG